MNEMKPLDAFNNVAAACRVYKGTVDEHQALQKSLQIIAEVLKAAGHIPADPAAPPAAEPKV